MGDGKEPGTVQSPERKNNVRILVQSQKVQEIIIREKLVTYSTSIVTHHVAQDLMYTISNIEEKITTIVALT
jgi:hypothetical protein